MTIAVSRQNSVCSGSSLSMRSFAIDEPGSSVHALYATLLHWDAPLDIDEPSTWAKETWTNTPCCLWSENLLFFVFSEFKQNSKTWKQFPGTLFKLPLSGIPFLSDTNQKPSSNSLNYQIYGIWKIYLTKRDRGCSLFSGIHICTVLNDIIW